MYFIFQSPYKKLREANDQWVGYINIAKLTPNKAYLMLGITPTNHSSYGPGQQAVVQGKDGRKWRTQLPGKYLAQLSKEHLEQFKEDIRMGSSPYLIFREKMIDNSYRIDIVENSKYFYYVTTLLVYFNPNLYFVSFQLSQ